MIYEVVIVGAGPAGISCATRLKRAGIDFLLFNEDEFGGQLNNAFLIENLQGINAVKGRELVGRLSDQISSLKIDVLKKRVDLITYIEARKLFNVKSGKTRVFAKNVVLATGTKERRKKEYEIPGRTYYRVGRMEHISNSDVAVVGSGEAAFDSALTLADQGNLVRIFTKNYIKSVNETLYSRVLGHENIQIKTGEVPSSFQKAGGKITLKTNGVDYLFDFSLVSIGREPNLNDICDEALLERGGVFLCGDAKRGRLGHCPIAIKDGETAAMEIIKCR